MADKCSSCDQMKKENSLIRKSIIDTNKNYIEVVNENLALKQQVAQYRKQITGTGTCLNPTCTLCMQDDPKTWIHP